MLTVKSAKKKNTSKQIKDMMLTLRGFDEIVMVPTDKTNPYKPLDIKVYGKLVVIHPLKRRGHQKKEISQDSQKQTGPSDKIQTNNDKGQVLCCLIPNIEKEYPNSNSFYLRP